MNKIVISQPMFFPWVGLFEQINLSDIYVHYDNTQFSKGSFVNRVQIKTVDGFKWLTVPLKELKLGNMIKDTVALDKYDWRKKHLKFLSNNYSKAPFVKDMLKIVEEIYSLPTNNICEINIYSIECICKYFEIYEKVKFVLASDLDPVGNNTQKVLDMVKKLKGTIYITGHGAKNYLDHKDFEVNNIEVEYMNYEKKQYNQLYEGFNPYVSILDLIACEGKSGKDIICSKTTNWRSFNLNE